MKPWMMSATAIAALAMSGAAGAQETAASTRAAATTPAPTAATGSDSNVRLSIGANFSSGDYSTTDRTQVWSVPVGLRWTSGNFHMRVSVPYVVLDGPGSLIDTPQGRDGGGVDDSGGRGGDSGRGRGRGGSGNSGSGGGSGGTEVDDDGVVTPGDSGRTSGLGDVSVAAGYSLPLTDSLFVDAGVRVKVPTASRAQRLGTGELDVTTSLDLAYEFAGGSIYAGGRRKFAGNSATSSFQNIWGAGGGASLRLSSGVSVGADYDWSQPSVAGNGDISEVTGWMSFRLNRQVRMNLYAATGLSTNSTDFSSGATLSYRF